MNARVLDLAFIGLLILTASAYALSEAVISPGILWTIIAAKCLIIQGVFMGLVHHHRVGMALLGPTLLVLVLLAVPG